jgi:hypothetical protein
MALFYKKVDAIQFIVTDEDKECIAKKEPVFFDGCQVKHVGGENYIAVLQQGENLIRISNTQWLVRHPDGQLQILWPDRFEKYFVKGADDNFAIEPQGIFTIKPNNQPNILI